MSGWLEHPPGPLGLLSRMTEGWGSEAQDTYACGTCGAEVDYGETCQCKIDWDEEHGI